jgi:hypothetical protein
VRGGCNLRSTAAYRAAAPAFDALIGAVGDRAIDELNGAPQTVMLPLTVYAGDEPRADQMGNANQFANWCDRE